MPLYEYQCEDCKEITEEFKKVAECLVCPTCKCGGNTAKIISKANVHPDFEPYLDENIGDEPTWIKSKQHRKQVMKENGVTDGY